jgi:hypothetical protein
MEQQHDEGDSERDVRPPHGRTDGDASRKYRVRGRRRRQSFVGAWRDGDLLHTRCYAVTVLDRLSSGKLHHRIAAHLLRRPELVLIRLAQRPDRFEDLGDPCRLPLTSDIGSELKSSAASEEVIAYPTLPELDQLLPIDTEEDRYARALIVEMLRQAAIPHSMMS